MLCHSQMDGDEKMLVVNLHLHNINTNSQLIFIDDSDIHVILVT